MSVPNAFRRRDFLRCSAMLAVFATVASSSKRALASVEVPLPIQVKMALKAAAHDRAFAERAGAQARVVVAFRAGNPESERVAGELVALLKAAGKIGTVDLSVEQLPATSEGEIKTILAKAHLVYVAPEVKADTLSSMAKGGNVLTVATGDREVEQGIVLGFRLKSSRPRMVINFPQSQLQGVRFPAPLLELADVIQ